MLAGELEEGAQALALDLDAAGDAGDGLGDEAAQALAQLVDDFHEDGLLVREVNVEGAERDAALSGNIGDGCALVALLPKDDLGRPQQLLARLLASGRHGETSARMKLKGDSCFMYG